MSNGADRFTMQAAGKIGSNDLTLADLMGQSSLNMADPCSGVLTCYKIVKNDKGEFVNDEETEELGEYNFLNGILNDKDRAETGLGPVHLDEKIVNKDIDSFVLIHNPSERFIKDSWETFKDKFGHSKAAIQLAAMIHQKNAKGESFHIVAHSQGTAILN